jgi:hypothetical protein
MNRRQEQRGWKNTEHDLYEWKNAVQEMERLPHWLKQARTGTLPTVHQQCSHSAPEAIEENRLVCALGNDVTKCPLLASLYATFAEQQEVYQRLADERDQEPGLQPDDADIAAARTCAWHIFMEKLKYPHLDTSGGYVQDEGDRRFWATTYRYLSMSDDEGARLAQEEE